MGGGEEMGKGNSRDGKVGLAVAVQGAHIYIHIARRCENLVAASISGSGAKMKQQSAMARR